MGSETNQYWGVTVQWVENFKNLVRSDGFNHSQKGAQWLVWAH